MSYIVRAANTSDLPYLPNIERSAGNLFRTFATSSTSAADSTLRDFSLEERKSIATLVDDEPTTADDHASTIRKWKTSLRSELGLNQDRYGDLLSENVDYGGVWVAVRIGETITESQSNLSIKVVEEPVGFISATIFRLGTIEDKDSASNEAIFAVHINEVSIHAAHQRHGLATRLIHKVCDTARILNDISSSRVGEWKEHSEVRHQDEQSQASRDDNIRPTTTPQDTAGAGQYATELSLNPKSNDIPDAAVRKIAFLTLTTFSCIPFNAPFYHRRFGFSDISPSLIKASFGDQAQHTWDEEQERFGAIGLSQRRCWMYRNV